MIFSTFLVQQIFIIRKRNTELGCYYEEMQYDFSDSDRVDSCCNDKRKTQKLLVQLREWVKTAVVTNIDLKSLLAMLREHRPVIPITTYVLFVELHYRLPK